MSNTIPEERFITKRTLWERSDAHYEAYQSQLKEVYTKISGIEHVVASEVSGIISENKKELEKIRMANNDQFQSTKKELEKIVNDAVTRMNQNMMNHITKVDKKINELLTLLEDKTDRKITERLQSIQQDAKMIYEAASNYKEDTDKQIQKYQVDLGLKMGLIDKKLTTLMSKFKLISSELS